MRECICFVCHRAFALWNIFFFKVARILFFFFLSLHSFVVSWILIYHQRTCKIREVWEFLQIWTEPHWNPSNLTVQIVIFFLFLWYIKYCKYWNVRYPMSAWQSGCGLTQSLCVGNFLWVLRCVCQPHLAGASDLFISLYDSCMMILKHRRLSLCLFERLFMMWVKWPT